MTMLQDAALVRELLAVADLDDSQASAQALIVLIRRIAREEAEACLTCAGLVRLPVKDGS